MRTRFPDHTLMRVTDHGAGTATITGGPGAVPGGSAVHLRNETSGDTTAIAASDSSFSVVLVAASGNRIIVDVGGGPAW
jgi:hypothetical protein